MADDLALTLVRNGIEVLQPGETIRVAGRTLPPEGTYVVPLDQPAHRLARNLLDPHTPMDSAFVRLQRERRALRMPDQIYDVTAWSLPLLWDVERIEADGVPAGSLRPVTATAAEPASRTAPEGAVGWLIPWGRGGAAAVAALLGEGALVRAAGGDFTLAGRRHPIGTTFVRRADNPDLDLRSLVARAAAQTGAAVLPLDSTFSEAGVSAGSRANRALRLPRVVLAWDEPTSTYSAGWARYVLEQRYGIPVSAIRTSRLGGISLTDYDVIVLPHGGGYSDALGAGGLDRLRAWIADGGTLVTMGESSRWAAREGILATSTELRGGAPEFGPGAGGDEAGPGPRPQPIDLLEAIGPPRESPEPVPGAVLNVDLRTDHWLASGTDGRVGVVVEGSRVFSPITLDRGANVGTYAVGDDLVAGGIVWDASRPQLQNKAYLVHQPVGRGQVVAFAEDPNYRAYAEASQLLFVNAVLLGPGR
ncbi:MAG: hypothetical protein KY453_05610 [Gemmatimonadetes bacterium]|nr:hypothetical protein [Gemmatimonadota bacterium]